MTDNDIVIKSNDYIINLLKLNNPFIISRCGGPESSISVIYSQTNKIDKRYLHTLSNNAGIYIMRVYI